MSKNQTLQKVANLFVAKAKGELSLEECSIIKGPEFMKFVGFAVAYFDDPDDAIDRFIAESINIRNLILEALIKSKIFIKKTLQFFRDNDIPIKKMKRQMTEEEFEEKLEYLTIPKLLVCLYEKLDFIYFLKFLAEDKGFKDIEEFNIDNFEMIFRMGRKLSSFSRRSNPKGTSLASSLNRALSPNRRNSTVSPSRRNFSERNEY
uniref:Uncharacterized protein n=1 Tax=viral metagenome TaxID=1070528 RepID=A0A6C0ADI8_9ZZZZ